MRRDLVANQILEQAADLFAQRGFSGTSLQEVADALKINRTALYHYIGGKQDLFATLVEGLTRVAADRMEALADDSSLRPLEKLHRAIADMAARIASNPARFRLLLLSEGAMEGSLAKEHNNARRRTLDALTRIISDAIDAGDLRTIDPHLAAFAVFGMCNWVAWWYRQDRIANQTPDFVGETMADIAISGLRLSGTDSNGSGTSVQRAISRMQSDLSYLERSLGEDQAEVATPLKARRRTSR